MPHSTFGRRFWKGGFPSHFRESKSRSAPPRSRKWDTASPISIQSPPHGPRVVGGSTQAPGHDLALAPPLGGPSAPKCPLGLKPEVGSQKIRKCIKSSADQGPGCPKASKTPLKPCNRPKQGPTLQRLPQQGVTAKITVHPNGHLRPLGNVR
jgi:hypothetical protein